MTLRGGSLFAGIGGLELGAEVAGLDVDWRWQVELDPFCRRVLAKHFPETDRSVHDVREAGAHNLEPVDVITAGWPCQDLSVAGRGAGLAGERSGLFFDVARIVRDLRPRFLLLENVTAIFARGLGDVLGELASSGYDAEWDCIPASSVGACHQRDRVFVVAHALGEPLRNEPRGEPRPRRSGPCVPLDLGARGGPPRSPTWAASPGVPRADDGLPRGVDGRRRRARERALGNAVVPQAAAIVWRRIGELSQ